MLPIITFCRHYKVEIYISKNNCPFQIDLAENKYHIYNPSNSKIKGYYPNEFFGLISEISKLKTIFDIKIGNVYSVRGFFAISEPIDNQGEYQSGYLDLKILLLDRVVHLCEICTVLPSIFILQKGSKIKIRKEHILFKQNYH